MALPIVSGSDGAWGTTLNNFLGGADGAGVPTIPNNRIPFLSGGNHTSSANLTFNGTTLTVNTLVVSTGTNFSVTAAGLCFINDTANANMTNGITLRQSTGVSNEILALKNADMATGLTTATIYTDVETDDFLTITPRSSAGGAIIQVAMGTVGGGIPLILHTFGGAPDTTDTTISDAAMEFFVSQHDGANALADMAANSNGFVWGEITAAGVQGARMILKADDGELHLGNTTLVALDEEDDVGLVRAMQREISNGLGMRETPWDNQYGTPVFNYEALRRANVLGEKDASGNCLFRVQPRFAMNEGAIWQTYVRLMETREQLIGQIEELRSQNLLLERRMRLIENASN